MMRAAALIACTAMLSACGGGDQAPRAETPLASRDCGAAGGDSARAVCLALNEVERIDRFRVAAYGIERYGDTICVRMGPDRERYPAMLDGESAVAVLHTGAGDRHDQQQPGGVHRDVSLAAIDFLAGVEAAAGAGDGLRAA